MELQNEITIENTPALVSVNFDQLRERLEKELERYKVVVTADTVADAKKLATELNATKKLIDDRRKAEVAKASEPIKQFDEQMKDLVMMCAQGRQDIIDQVSRFEDETRELCRGLLNDIRTNLWQDYAVSEEFQSAEIEDLVKISSVTAKSNLTKAAKDQLESRVRDDKAVQDRTERRLLELENQSYKAGLSAPLQRGHVESFLFAEDERYQSELNRIIAVEIERQDQAEKAMRARLEKEQEQKRQAEQRQQAREQTPASNEPEPEPAAHAEPSKPAPKGMLNYTVTCTFNITAPAGLTVNEIDAELRRVMGKTGLSETLAGVYVKPHGVAA